MKFMMEIDNFNSLSFILFILNIGTLTEINIRIVITTCHAVNIPFIEQLFFCKLNLITKTKYIPMYLHVRDLIPSNASFILISTIFDLLYSSIPSLLWRYPSLCFLCRLSISTSVRLSLFFSMVNILLLFLTILSLPFSLHVYKIQVVSSLV